MDWGFIIVIWISASNRKLYERKLSQMLVMVMSMSAFQSKSDKVYAHNAS